MDYKRIITILAIIATVGLTANAQTSGFRSKGYKGSVSVVGLPGNLGGETSHGLMLDSDHYLGLGVGYFVQLNNDTGWDFDDIGRSMYAFVDYQNFCLDGSSTPFIECKLGMVNSNKHLNKHYNLVYNNYLLFEPGIGWSWALTSGQALSAALSAQCRWRLAQGNTYLIFGPKLAISFDF